MFAALALLSAFLTVFSFGAGVEEPGPAPWWAVPGLFGGAALTCTFVLATVIRLVFVIVTSLRRR